MHLRDGLFQRSWEGYFGVYFQNKYQNNTPVSAERVRHKSTYIMLFLTQHNNDKNCDKNDNLHTSIPWLTW